MAAGKRRYHPVPWLVLVWLAAGATGCTKTEIVYRDREPFNPPPDLASGLLGYHPQLCIACHGTAIPRSGTARP